VTRRLVGSHGTALLATPSQRLHAAAKAAQAVFDPDSAGGTGYGTDASLVRKMGTGGFGTPQAWPDDLAFRPGVVYVGVVNGGRLASLWIFEPSRRALIATVGAPHHRVSYENRPPADQIALGITLIRPGVLSADMIRAALAHAGFRGIAISGIGGGQLQDGVRPLMAGGNVLSSGGTGVGFVLFRSAADAHKAANDQGLAPHHVSVILGAAWIHYTWATGRPNRSKAFLGAIAELRRERHME